MGKILENSIPDIRRILKRKMAGIWLFTRLFKSCNTLITCKGGKINVNTHKYRLRSDSNKWMEEL